MHCLSSNFSAMFERVLKKEVVAVGLYLVDALTLTIKEVVSSAMTESLQVRGIGDEAINHLDESVNPKLEKVIAREIKAGFETSSNRALKVKIAL